MVTMDAKAPSVTEDISCLSQKDTRPIEDPFNNFANLPLYFSKTKKSRLRPQDNVLHKLKKNWPYLHIEVGAMVVIVSVGCISPVEPLLAFRGLIT